MYNLLMKRIIGSAFYKAFSIISSGPILEKIGAIFEMTGAEVKLVEEIFYVKDENGVFVKPQ